MLFMPPLCAVFRVCRRLGPARPSLRRLLAFEDAVGFKSLLARVRMPTLPSFVLAAADRVDLCVRGREIFALFSLSALSFFSFFLRKRARDCAVGLSRRSETPVVPPLGLRLSLLTPLAPVPAGAATT